MKDTNVRKTGEGLMEMLGRIHVDIAVIQKDCEGIKLSLADTKKTLDEKTKEDKELYASKYIEKVVWVLMIGTFGWALNQILNLIPTAYALFN